MVTHIVSFEYIVTSSEVEALVLECNLIKRYNPKYNIRLKDDKHYPYIRIDINNDYPKVRVVRSMKKDGAVDLLYGEFPSAASFMSFI